MELCYRVELFVYIVYYCSSAVIVISVYLVGVELELGVEFSTVGVELELELGVEFSTVGLY